MATSYLIKLHFWFWNTFKVANEISIHQNCIELHMTGVYKYLNGLSPDDMDTIFKLKQNAYNLRYFHIFEYKNPKTKTLF